MIRDWTYLHAPDPIKSKIDPLRQIEDKIFGHAENGRIYDTLHCLSNAQESGLMPDGRTVECAIYTLKKKVTEKLDNYSDIQKENLEADRLAKVYSRFDSVFSMTCEGRYKEAAKLYLHDISGDYDFLMRNINGGSSK